MNGDRLTDINKCRDVSRLVSCDLGLADNRKIVAACYAVVCRM